MLIYIITAFSFLSANLGWFGGMPQTEVFFWVQIIVAALSLVICGIAILVAMSRYGFGGIAGAGLGTLVIFVGAFVCLLNLLAAWICTMLWSLDFFLAYQIMCIGSATAGLFRSKNEKSD